MDEAVYTRIQRIANAFRKRAGANNVPCDINIDRLIAPLHVAVWHKAILRFEIVTRTHLKIWRKRT